MSSDFSRRSSHEKYRYLRYLETSRAAAAAALANRVDRHTSDVQGTVSQVLSLVQNCVGK